jgi:hypothetical protein
VLTASCSLTATEYHYVLSLANLHCSANAGQVLAC